MLEPSKQRQFAVEVVSHLRAQGFEAYWAGGCVRDQLLDRTPGDYDVATSAKPDEIREAFGRRKTLAIGAAFGVITVLGPKDAGQIEVATFRQDLDYSDGRRPDGVVFSSAEEDAKRRDFTINGLFYDPVAERVIDFVGGVADIHAGVVRAIGDPHERFREDKLRMLRAARFAASLGFFLEDNTLAAIREMADQVTIVSPERIAAEMEKMLLDRRRERAVRLLAETGLIARLLPDVAAKFQDSFAYNELLELLDAVKEPSFALCLAMLLYVAGGVELAESVGRQWRLSRHDAGRTSWLLAHWGALNAARRMPWSKLQPLLVDEGAAELVVLHDALAHLGDCAPEEVEYCRKKLALPPHELDPSPLLTGHGLISKGIKPGPLYARVLQQVRDAQLDGKVADHATALALVDELLSSEDETGGS